MINALSHIGLKRNLNEDSFWFFSKDNNFIMTVSDGMGGHNAGEVASQLCIDAIRIYKEDNDVFENIKKSVTEMVLFANKAVFLKSCSEKSMRGMGATLVVALGDNEEIYVANIGDSRGYIINQESIVQITQDHSYVGELLKKGAITPEEAKVHPNRNQILKAIGIGNDVFPDIFKVTPQKGDILMLCSDGLTNMVSDEEIKTIVTDSQNLEYKVSKLIEKANENGGADNITVILKECE